MKLCIGTVQFGMNYGIYGRKKPKTEDSLKMLDYATQNGIFAIDTAQAYGEAEKITGMFLNKKTIPRSQLHIISKLLPNCLDNALPRDYKQRIRNKIQESLKVLKTDYLDTFLLHTARYVFQEEILEALYQMKQEGLCHHVGVSVYEMEEVNAGIVSSKVDILQVPYSILDQRMNEAALFEKAQISQTDIHVRSAFLQGLLVESIDMINPSYSQLISICEKWRRCCREYNVNPVMAAMHYVKQTTTASHLVFGVHDMQQLTEDIQSFEENIDISSLCDIASEFVGLPNAIVMPSLWSSMERGNK